MSVIDTSLAMERLAEGKAITEDVSIITIIEYPMLLEYERFKGDILYPKAEDLRLAVELQAKLRKLGSMKPAADLIIAATCIGRGEALLTIDGDFEDISRVSELKLS